MRINSFYIMPTALLISLLLYSLKLSDLYTIGEMTNIDISILFICLMSFILGKICSPIFKTRVDDCTNNVKPLFLFILFGALLECLAYGGIPLVDIIMGYDYKYKDFGIKTFHVFYLSYLAAFSIVNFERYLQTKERVLLLQCLICLAFPILIVNRGTFLLIIFPMVILWLSKIKITFKVIVRIVLLFLFVIIAFGFLGDSRMKASGYESEQVIFKVGKANDIFYKLPSGFFWTYLYASSPYANLTNQEITGNYDKGNLDDFLLKSISPDFISKHSDSTLDDNRITEELNVGTGFYQGFISFGFLGIFLLFFYFCFFVLFFTLLNRHRYRNCILSILATISFFMLFTNMLVFSLFFIQLFIITIFSRLKIGNTRLI